MIFSLNVSFYYYNFYLLFLAWISETKRKRHDMTPISKSQVSSGLLNAIKRVQGQLNYFGLIST
jgi:hypothetical protein